MELSAPHPTYVLPRHDDCAACLAIVQQRATRHIRNLVKMRAVAASLPLSYAPRLDSGLTKQETPGTAIPGGLTAPTPGLADGRVADVDGDTGPRQK
jgi:hypothetical protein